MAGHRRPSSPVPASLSVNDDMLTEILLRLPPAPSSLPRASLVCKRWRRLVAGPDFLRRFRARHRRNAPLLGFFTQGSRGICFTPNLEPPDRIPTAFFSFLEDLRGCQILCCRHGLVLLFIPTRLMVWDPSAGYLSELSVPQGFDCWTTSFSGTVLRNGGDAHGDDHFQVFIVARTNRTEASACVYSSETGEWGKPISTTCSSSMAPRPRPGTLVGRSLYWSLYGNSHGILEFDLDRQCLTVTSFFKRVHTMDRPDK
ncbi:hypothetical protein QOZ80_5BG0429160 [Eleusine coracana subsp. coracana]|nr:hypothetical protein QOZ80_5BG0429160 [Eleusine coracana subsp. coracana]